MIFDDPILLAESIRTPKGDMTMIPYDRLLARGGGSMDWLKQYILDRIEVDPASGCWVWTGAKRKGYGIAHMLGVTNTVSRLAYQAWIGPVPDGMYVCHHCDNPGCCNPDHLFDGSQRDNIRDAVSKGRMPRQDGEHNHGAKLTEAEVKEIVRDYDSGVPIRPLAERYGVSVDTIWRIVTGSRWATVTRRLRRAQYRPATPRLPRP